ncbi:MAG TPA: BamA/TamA family outer membrane protein [Longimicrobiaceae bacterium]
MIPLRPGQGFALALGVFALVTGDAPARAQDSVTVVPGPQYAGSGLRGLIFGDDYRAAWATPIRVPVLALDTFAGGLTPTQRGGGNQTISLRFLSHNGREYTFRSVDKFPQLSDEPALHGTLVGTAIQDQVSSLHPAGALMVPPILDAVGVLHPEPSLAVMPDDPALGEFREEFAGMLGIIEERPEEGEGGTAGFGGFSRIVGTETLLERLEEDRTNRVDATEFLTARLVDLMIGDWDRHDDQWRWAEVKEPGGITRYRPIPRDRDYAFVDYDGLLMVLGRTFAPNAVRFGRGYYLEGLTLNGRELDRRLLSGLDRSTWDSVAAFVVSRVTNEVIDEAMSRLPPEYVGDTSREIGEILRWRRDALPEAAEEFYDLISTEVDVPATDEDDFALVERIGDGEVRVRLFPGEEGQSSPDEGDAFFDRVFRRSETREIRIYLHGGDDRAVVRGGEGRSIGVRLIGGGGDDHLTDSSTVGGHTSLHDTGGENELVRGRGTIVDTAEYEAPEAVQSLSGESFRDWGALRRWIPSLDYHSSEGLILGLTRSYTRYGFRQVPYDFRLDVGLEVGTLTGAFAGGVRGDFRRPRSSAGMEVELFVSQLDPLHFYGFGNESEASENADFYVVRQNRLLAGVSWYQELGRAARFSLGPVVEFTRTQEPEGTPFAAGHEGGRNYGQVGGRSELVVDTRDATLFPTRGVSLRVGGSGYPAFWDADEAFGEAHAVASAYLTPLFRGSPTLALRAGGMHLWGDFPIHEAAFLGGSATVRGYRFQRYAGDAMVFGNAEARLPLGKVKWIVRGDLGVLGLADAGRVYVDGESPGGWHTAYGGGLWFRFRVRSTLIAASALYAEGDHGTIYFKFGVPF